MKATERELIVSWLHAISAECERCSIVEAKTPQQAMAMKQHGQFLSNIANRIEEGEHVQWHLAPDDPDQAEA